MMEGIGNFSVKRKRNLDPLDISEIIVANNFYILLKLKKKRKERWIGPVYSEKHFWIRKTRGKKLEDTKRQGWRFA